MSEYASRLTDAITELMNFISRSREDGRVWTDGELDRVLELDGRIEALRIRLGIEALPPPNPTELAGRLWLGGNTFRGANELIGFSKIGVYRTQPDLDIHHFERRTPINSDDAWTMRMKSLRAIAQELAVAPKLDPEEVEIVGLVSEVGRRLTTTEILAEFNKRGIPKADSTIKLKLSQLTKRNVLVNRSDTTPKGYGLPEWS